MGQPVEGTMDGNRNTSVQMAGLIGGPLIAILFLAFFDMDPARPMVGRTAAVAFVMAVWWVTEAAPLAATSLLPVFLFPALGIMNGKDVATQYFNHVIFLFLGGFLVAAAMERWNLHRRIALNILIVLGKSLGGILLGFMLATGFLSMWMSNTACAMIMMPIMMAVIVKLEEMFGKDRLGSFSKGLLLSVAYSASIGGVATIVGTPPNAAFVKIFSIQFPNAPEITFAQFLALGFPISASFLFFGWLYLMIAFKPAGKFQFDRQEFRSQLAGLGPVKYEEKVVMALFLALVFLWIFREPIDTGLFRIPGWGAVFPNPKYLTDGASAIFVACLLFAIPSKTIPGQRIMEWDSVLKLPWDIVLLFGGGFALAQGFEDSGLSMWVGERLKGVGSMSPVALVALICTISTFLTEFTSNTATAQILLPIFASLAVAAKVNPLLTMIPATFGVSFAFMLPVATPPNAIVFGSGRLRIWDMAKAGLVMNLIGIAVVVIASLTLLPLIWGVELHTFPDWAGKK